MTGKRYRNEADLRSYFGDIAKAQGFKVQHIESGVTGCGIADTYLSRGAVKGWIEFKLIDSIASVGQTLTVDYGGGQYAWLKGFYEHGTDCWLIIGFAEGIFVARNRSILKEYLGEEVAGALVPLNKGTNIRELLMKGDL